MIHLNALEVEHLTGITVNYTATYQFNFLIDSTSQGIL